MSTPARRKRRNSFDLDRPDARDTPDPSLSAPLRAVLAPVESVPIPEPEPRPEPPAGGPEPDPEIPTSRAARSGGRPAAEQAPAGGIKVITVRIPATLYDSCLPLAKGEGKPSWGQLIGWTCEDHPHEVKNELAAAHAASGRRVRGQNRAGSATTQISPRLDEAELAAFDAVRGDLPYTVAVTAALIVARRYAV